jgi:glycine hydroxymethyltransferase
LILAKLKHGPALDKALFPGVQGGPLVHVIAGKAVCFLEAEKPEFVEYQKQVLANMKALETTLKKAGLHIVADGTDNHLLSFDVTKFGITGDIAENLLDKINITCNKNTIPFDPNRPNTPSGIRIGAAALTTRGLKERDFVDIGDILITALKNNRNIDILEACRKRVALITDRFPLK